MATHYADRLEAAVRAKRTAAVVGIDPVLESLPGPYQFPYSAAAAARGVEAFCREVLDLVAPHVPAVKINIGFFEAFHEIGVEVFYNLIAHAHARGLLVISDVKRGDIGSTAKLYARGHLAAPAFDDIAPERVPDAVTLAGYLGENAVKPFIEIAVREGRGMYVLVRPSDPGADRVHEFGAPVSFYRHMAALVRAWGSGAGLSGAGGLSCVGAVVAPKDAVSTAELRAALPTTPWLVPGFGAQGGTVDSVRPCFLAGGRGAVVAASRSVIFAYREPGYQARFGDDWRASVDAACRKFAGEIGALGSGDSTA